MPTTLLTNVLSWWVERCRRFAWPIVLAALALAVLSFQYTRSHLDIDTDTADMIARDLPWRQNYIDYKNDFPQFVDILLLVVDGDTPDLADAAAKRLAESLSAESDLVKWVERPGDSDFFRRNGLLYLDAAELDRLSGRLARAQPFLGQLTSEPTLPALFSLLSRAMRGRLEDSSFQLTPILAEVAEAAEAELSGRYYRLSWQTLMQGGAVAGNGLRRFVVVKPRLDFGELFPAGPILNRIQALKTTLGLVPERGVRVRVTGEPALAHEELESAARGTQVALTLALIMVVAVLLVGLRSVWLLIATVVTLLVGLSWTAAFATFAIGRLNLISVAFAVLYIGLGVDYAIHYCLRCRELRASGKSWADALNGSARDVGVALAICAVTTGIGFFAFVPTAFVGVSELGIISGVGMFISLAASLTLLPALLELMPRPRLRVAPAEAFAASAAPVTSWPRRHRRSVRTAAAALALAAAIALPAARFDDNPLNLRDPHSESVATVRELMANGDQSPWTLSVMVADRQGAEALAQRLEALEEVEQALHLARLVPRNQEQRLAIIDDMSLLLGLGPGAGNTDIRSDPASRRKAAENLVAALERFAEDAPSAAERAASDRLLAGLDRVLADDASDSHLAGMERSLMSFLPAQLERLRTALAPEEIGVESLPAAIKRDWLAPDGRWRVEVSPAGDLNDTRVLDRFVGAVRSVAPDATGAPIIYLESGRAVVGAFKQALVSALVLISLLLLLVLRRIVEVGLVLAPLLLAMLVTVAVMVSIGMPFNFANVIALPLLLGLGANNGIHMVYRMRAAPPSSGDLLRTSTARGVVFSALTTMCSFGNLAFTSHRGSASMGVLLTIGLALVLVFTLVLTPALQSREVGGNQ